LRVYNLLQFVLYQQRVYSSVCSVCIAMSAVWA